MCLGVCIIDRYIYIYIYILLPKTDEFKIFIPLLRIYLYLVGTKNNKNDKISNWVDSVEFAKIAEP